MFLLSNWSKKHEDFSEISLMQHEITMYLKQLAPDDNIVIRL